MQYNIIAGESGKSTAMCSYCCAIAGQILRSLDGEQLDFKNERGAAGNVGGRALVAIGDGGGTHQLGLSADFHLFQAFGPTTNHTVKRKFGRFIALVGAVK